METPRCSLDAALPVVENLQKYRYILENIDGIFRDFSILVPRALLTRGQPSATRGSGQIHIKLASDWPQRNIWFIVNMNKNTQALHEALVSLWRKLGEKTLLKLKEQQYKAVRKIVVDNRPQKR